MRFLKNGLSNIAQILYAIRPYIGLIAYEVSLESAESFWRKYRFFIPTLNPRQCSQVVSRKKKKKEKKKKKKKEGGRTLVKTRTRLRTRVC